jgi:phosphomannomutase
MSELIISVSGLRGIVGQSLTPDVAIRYVSAFAASLPPDATIIVGRDGRQTGKMLRSAIIAAITATGRSAIDVDVAATPTIGVLVRERNAQGAVQITASHNPPPYNGMKLFGADGRVLDAASGAKIRQAYFDDLPQWVGHDEVGMISSESDPHAPHLEAVLDTVDGLAIRAAAPRVLLDSNHGSGGILGRRLLESLGCEVVFVGEEPHGKFAHVPEPTAENLKSIGKMVVDQKCVVGFCQDPDADRLALIDETGRYIGEEYTLALCVSRILADPELRGPIVINGATSGMSERIANQYHVGCHRSAVGEANVADMMIEVGASYGGEGNGGPIDPEVGYVRDSFVGMAQILDLMVRTGRPLSFLADDLPKLHIHKAKADASPSQLPTLFEKLIAKYPEADADTGDGLRLAWSDRWLLVRGSNTEPIVRFIAEAESENQARAMCDEAAALI